MSPAKHGWKQCLKCHCWRPPSELELNVCKAWPACAKRKGNGATGPELPK